MKVIVVSDYAAVNGGAAKVAIESSIALAEAGTGGAYFGWSLAPDPRLLAAPGLEVVAPDRPAIPKLGQKARLVRGIWNREAAAALDELLARFDPQETVVHVHSVFDSNTAAIAGPIRARGFAMVYTAHDYALACPYGGFYDHEQKAICTRKPLGGACIGSRCNDGSRLARMWFLSKQAAAWGPGGLPRSIPHLIVVSEFSRAILAPHLSPATKIHHVPNFVDLAQDVRAPAEGGRDFLYIGRLSPEKDPATFLRAARLAGVRAVVAGSGILEEGLRREFPEAEFLGWVSPETVAVRLKAARALVFPSRWYETAGLSALEAMAVGVPVFVSDCCAAREVVEGLGGGAVFPNQNDAALAKLLGSDDAAVEGWSRSGYDGYWRAPLTMEHHVANLLAVYEEALKTRKG